MGFLSLQQENTGQLKTSIGPLQEVRSQEKLSPQNTEPGKFREI